MNNQKNASSQYCLLSHLSGFDSTIKLHMLVNTANEIVGYDEGLLLRAKIRSMEFYDLIPKMISIFGMILILQNSPQDFWRMKRFSSDHKDTPDAKASPHS